LKGYVICINIYFDDEHLRHEMPYEFWKNNKATGAKKNISDIYSNMLDIRKCQRWFAKCCSRDLNLQNMTWGTPSKEMND